VRRVSENLASADIEKVKGANLEKLKEILAVPIGHLNPQKEIYSN
jgi:hypothetical protein